METPDRNAVERWANGLEDVDREIARLALLCGVRVLDPANIERVLRKDAAVCGTDNPVAFAKLHDLLVMYFALRQKAGHALGQMAASEIERYAVDGMRAAFPELEAPWPPARK